MAVVPSFDLLTKVLGVDAPIVFFFRNTPFYFSLLHSYVVSTVKATFYQLSIVAQLVAFLPAAQAIHVK
jgi:hypothetical protein